MALSFADAAGVFTGIDEHGAVIGEHAFVAASDLFVEFGCVQVPVNTSGFFDTVAVQLVRSIFAAQMFSYSLQCESKPLSVSPIKQQRSSYRAIDFANGNYESSGSLALLSDLAQSVGEIACSPFDAIGRGLQRLYLVR